MRRKVFKRRIFITAVGIGLISAVLIGRIISLHFSDKIITETPEEKTTVFRGAIKDRSGFILAMSVDAYSLYANPTEISDITKTASELASLTGLSSKFLKERLDNNRRFVWIKRKMDRASMEAIKKRRLPGVGFRKEFKRVYPYSSLAANIVGFTGIDNTGLEGMEYEYDSVLSGKSLANRDAEIVYGKHVFLTIDRFVQNKTEEELKAAVNAFSAKQGAAVILDVESGRILALAKYPTFNSSRYEAYSSDETRNFSVVDTYEPGSTMKIISMATAHEYNPRLLERRHVCTGAVKIGDVIINCEYAHGDLSIDDIIKHSCNVGVIEIMRSVPKDFFHASLKNFGFGESTNSGMPGEATGILRPVAGWSGLSKYSISIGYELSVTSLQLAAAFAAIANNGVYNSPQIVERIENWDGSVSQQFVTHSRGRVCSKETASKMLKLMEGTVSGGTGRRAALNFYKAVGKTGTSRKYSANKGLYINSPVASFAGIAPVGTGSVCMLVIIDAPATGQGGGTVAAPVFAGTLNRILPYLGIKQYAVKGTNPRQTKEQLPAFENNIMPNFIGMDIASSFALLKQMEDAADITATTYGTGRVYRQQPPAGQTITDGKVAVYFKED